MEQGASTPSVSPDFTATSDILAGTDLPSPYCLTASLNHTLRASLWSAACRALCLQAPAQCPPELSQLCLVGIHGWPSFLVCPGVQQVFVYFT